VDTFRAIETDEQHWWCFADSPSPVLFARLDLALGYLRGRAYDHPGTAIWVHGFEANPYPAGVVSAEPAVAVAVAGEAIAGSPVR